MDRIIDERRIEAWKKLENESKGLNVPLLVDLEKILFSCPEDIVIKEGITISKLIAKSGIYLNHGGCPEYVSVFEVVNVIHYSVSPPPVIRKFEEFNCLSYSRGNLEVAKEYKLIPNIDGSPERLKLFFERIRLLEMDESLRKYTGIDYYGKLIIENSSKYWDILMDESKNKFKGLNDTMDKLLLELRKDKETY